MIHFCINRSKNQSGFIDNPSFGGALGQFFPDQQLEAHPQSQLI
jgi:hypothetical protein